MNVFKKTILGAALAVVSSGAFASSIGGVVWDSANINDFMGRASYNSTVFGLGTAAVGQTITAWGNFSGFNDNVFNVSGSSSRCNACELTYQATYDISAFNALTQSFTFSNVSMSVYVDSTPDYDTTTLTTLATTATDGVLFLGIQGSNWVGTNLGAQGFGSVLSGNAGGLARDYFDTNTINNGSADLDVGITGGRIASNFSRITASVDVYGKTVDVPEPASLALLGMGLLSFGASRRKK